MYGKTTVNPEVTVILQELLSNTQSLLGKRFVGMYVYGSLATGDFDQSSDVDWVVATAEDVPDYLVPALNEMHARIFELPSKWARRLDGSYLWPSLLRRPDPAHPLHLYLDNGNNSLERSDHDNWYVQHYKLREMSVALAGPDPKSLIDPVSAVQLRREARESLQTWLDPMATKQEPLTHVWYQSYVILTVCRVLYTIARGDVASKRRAADWAKGVLDARWAEVIELAWADRADLAIKTQLRTDPKRRDATADFIRYALTWASAQ